MTTVLIAVDDSDDAVETACAAHKFFGDDAAYFVINVGRLGLPGMMWGTPYPVMGAALMYPQMWAQTADATQSVEETAAIRAEVVAHEAAVPDATTLGDAGDPARAILRAGREHRADVVVVGSHERGWFSRLFAGSVSDHVVKESEIPVLVVK